MRVLLDTHAFLWFVFGDPRMTPSSRKLIQNLQVVKFVSIASAWEIAIKVSIGKLSITSPPEEFVRNELSAAGILLLPIELAHVGMVSTLQLHHRDPFDRMLTARCLVDGLTLVSSDSAFDVYGVNRVW